MYSKSQIILLKQDLEMMRSKNSELQNSLMWREIQIDWVARNFPEVRIPAELSSLPVKPLSIRSDSADGRSSMQESNQKSLPNRLILKSIKKGLRANRKCLDRFKTDFAEIRVGELMPNVPLLTFSDIRLLPPSYQGLSLLATVLTQWRLQAGYLLSTSLRNSSGRDDLQAMLGHVPQRQASSDSFRYLGADYSYSTSTLLRLWHGKLEDIYQQNYLNLQYQYSLNADLRLKLDLGYFVASEQGEARLGQIDNKALYQLLSLEQGAHTAYLGYQQMNGDSAFPRVFANISILGNEVPTFEFASANERSWQLRYDTRFDALGLPGLVSTVRYIRSHGAMTATGADGQAFERDLDLAYQVQTGSLAGLSIRLRNVTARANYRTDIDENRLVLNYQLLFR
jgi:hypothetical protein